MESLWGFENNIKTTVENKSSGGYKLVPWLSWEEWELVRESLFSSSSHSVASALNRISAWRSRGCLPAVIEVTASIIEIQQKDPFFSCRVDQTVNNLHSEEMLAMLYCMAIMRLVNGVVEKTRKKTEISIAEAADMIGIPRMLIDIRHEGSHRDLPSLRLLRIASVKALDWLKSYYWEPQKKTAVFQGDGAANIRKEIKSKLHELLFCLKVKGSPESSSPFVKGKRSKKQIMKIMKNLLLLYSSFSSELVSVLLEYLLKASDLLDLVEVPKNSQGGPSIDNSQTASDDWKVVITKFSKKEPKLLPSLLKAVLDMIHAQNAEEYEIGEQHLISLDYSSENHQTRRLSALFAWLVSIRKVLKPSRKKCFPAENEDCLEDTFAPQATLIDLIRKCLLVSAPGNEHLMGSVLHFAKNTGNRYLIEKLNKLSFLTSSNVDTTEESPSVLSSEEDLILQEEYIRQAAENLDVLKLQKRKSGLEKTTTECDVGKCNRWVVAKSWNTCPIGMLPRTVGSSGRLPSLDVCDDCKVFTEPTERRELLELNQCGKREARCDIDLLNNSNAKKMRDTIEHCETEGEDAMLGGGVKGQLTINGVWRKVREEELLAIRSAIRILV